ncbi:hypothetical protein COI41_24715 [Bacillus toyonensis]|uniref:hypothetical protein n=1 Tax=Bacillus toyonensis TaxID=155322 RepID=UPI000BF1C44C|nr:hypothetical protein [Bacillus toyonensis]PEO61498.1 hypothetical protein CN567_20540 [Bacillus toyonensis]PFX80394.1 hypothetical protein COL37_22500 [Bacillus toyonensis]PFX83895.1 hypothetical protein COL38_05145 [Bacillus toyonensis]PGB14109.1 hypothetical protein COL98_18865 [Bacillus toyonensis]PHB45596.1 hypothetical protein COE91_28430 [Bacillus toyonensis]
MEIKSQELVATVIPREIFSTENLPHGTKFLKWEVENYDNAEHVSFDVMKNVTQGMGMVIFRDVLSGNRTNLIRNNNLCIASPKGTERPFLVSVYAIVI